MSSIGVRFAKAVAARSDETLKELLAEKVDFRGMTPDRVWEASTADEVVDDILLGEWFPEGLTLQGLDSLGTSMIGERERVGCRVHVGDDDGSYEAELQAFFTVTDDRITWLRMMSSGLEPVAHGEQLSGWHLWSTRVPARSLRRATDRLVPGVRRGSNRG
jgi:hypothetical protein